MLKENPLRHRLAACSENPDLIAAILAQSLGPRPELVPCMPWNGGASGGRPIMRHDGIALHPVAHFYGRPERINRVCQTRLCVNPYHFVILPRAPTELQHPLVFEAEESIDQCLNLAEAYRKLHEIPRHYVLAAWRNHRQLGMRPRHATSS